MWERAGVEESTEKRAGPSRRLLVLTVIAAAGAAAFLSFVRYAWRGQAANAPQVRRSFFGRLPAGIKKRYVVFSADVARFAVAVKMGEETQVVTNDGAGPSFSDCGTPVFDPRGRLFYWCVERRLGLDTVVLIADGQPLYTELAEFGGTEFSKDGSRWAYGGKLFVPDEVHAARLLVVIDGKEQVRYFDVTPPVFSPDSKHYAVISEDAEGRLHLEIDGVSVREIEESADPGLARISRTPGEVRLSHEVRLEYLADGTLAMLVPDADGWGVYVGEQRLASYPRNYWNSPGHSVLHFGDPNRAIKAASIVTAAEAAVLAWWERLEGNEERWRVVRNGEPEAIECLVAWEHQEILLSRDGKHLAYGCIQTGPSGDQTFFVYDGQKFGPYAGLWGATLSNDGRHFALLADDGGPRQRWRVVVDGQPRREGFDRAWPPVFSPDAKHVAWIGERSGRAVFYLDGHGIVSSDSVMHAPLFRPDGMLVWTGTRGERMTRVLARPAGPANSVTEE